MNNRLRQKLLTIEAQLKQVNGGVALAWTKFLRGDRAGLLELARRHATGQTNWDDLDEDSKLTHLAGRFLATRTENSVLGMAILQEIGAIYVLTRHGETRISQMLPHEAIRAFGFADAKPKLKQFGRSLAKQGHLYQAFLALVALDDEQELVALATKFDEDYPFVDGTSAPIFMAAMRFGTTKGLLLIQLRLRFLRQLKTIHKDRGVAFDPNNLPASPLLHHWMAEHRRLMPGLIASFGDKLEPPLRLELLFVERNGAELNKLGEEWINSGQIGLGLHALVHGKSLCA